MNSSEAARVGAKTRTATITAATSLTRLRLPGRNVLALAEQYDDLAERLNQAYSQRL